MKKNNEIILTVDIFKQIKKDLENNNIIHAGALYEKAIDEVEDNPSYFKEFLQLNKIVPSKIKANSLYPYDNSKKNIFVKVKEWLIQNKINYFEYIGAGDYSLPKKVEFQTTSTDNQFMNLHKRFVLSSKNYGNLSLLSTNFGENGVVSTNAHYLLFTKYRNGADKERGNYCFTSNCFKNEEIVKSTPFVNYNSLLYEFKGEFHSIDTQRFNTFLNVVENYKLYKDISKPIILETKTYKLLVNAELLLECFKTMIQLGHEKVYIGINEAYRKSIILSPIPELSMENDTILCMPLAVRDDIFGMATYNLSNNTAYINEVENSDMFNGKVKQKSNSLNEVKESKKDDTSYIQSQIDVLNELLSDSIFTYAEKEYFKLKIELYQTIN